MLRSRHKHKSQHVRGKLPPSLLLVLAACWLPVPVAKTSSRLRLCVEIIIWPGALWSGYVAYHFHLHPRLHRHFHLHFHIHFRFHVSALYAPCAFWQVVPWRLVVRLYFACVGCALPRLAVQLCCWAVGLMGWCIRQYVIIFAGRRYVQVS